MKIASACFSIMMKGYVSKFSQGIHALVSKNGSTYNYVYKWKNGWTDRQGESIHYSPNSKLLKGIKKKMTPLLSSSDINYQSHNTSCVVKQFFYQFYHS